MRFSINTVSVWLATVGAVAFTASAFTTPCPAFVARSVSKSAGTTSVSHPAGCSCSGCTGIHQPGCACPSCMSASHPTRLFADATDEAVTEAFATQDDVPVEVEAMDGIESRDEAHNAERNSRGSLKKHKREPKGTALADLEVGAQVTGTVKKIATYGAFVDIGAQSDGLLHISRMAEDFVSDVNDILKEGESVDVRIAAVDTNKNQISLSMITEEAENRAKESQAKQQKRGGGGGRRDYSAVLGQLQEKGWDSDAFVEGEVERTLDFGAFVKIDSSLLNSEVEGDMDGLVHISALSVGRVDSVTDVVKPGDKVQVRVKSIADGKVSLSMVSAEDERPRRGRPDREPVFEGAKDWKESLEKVQGSMPSFQNLPLVIDNRK